MSVDIMSMTASAQLEQMDALGLAPENNTLMAGRLPPGFSAGIHPVGFFDHFQPGGVASMLRDALPSAAPRMGLHFAAAAQGPADDLSPVYGYRPGFR